MLASALAIRAALALHPNAVESGRVRILCDGDDTVAFMEEEDEEAFVAGAQEIYSSLGHVLRVDGTAREIHQVEFCQHKPLKLSNGQWVMTPNPRKVLQTAFMASGHNAENLAYFGTLWDCRARVHAGMPVYQKLFTRLAAWNSARMNSEIFGFMVADPHLPAMPVTLDQRAMFDQQWDFPIDQQLAWEHARVSFEFDTYMGDPAEWGKLYCPNAVQEE